MHGTLCDFLSDIVQNSIEADAKRIVVTIAERKDTMAFSVQDDGKGMTGEVLRKAQDPFYTDGVKHKRRKVGLGIPFLIQTVESVGGSFSLQLRHPVAGLGWSSVSTSGISTVPRSETWPATLMGVFGYPGDQEVVVQRTLETSAGGDSYQVSKTEMLEVLGDLSQSGSLNLLREYLQSQETALDELRNHA